MTTYYWPVVLPIIAIGLVAYAVAAFEGYRHGRRKGYAEIKEEYHTLSVDHGLAVHRVGSLEQENEHLQAQLADRDEALQEARAEIKALNMRTVEMPEIATQAPIAARPRITPKRPPRK